MREQPIIRGEKDSEVKSWHHIAAEWLSIELKIPKKGVSFRERETPFLAPIVGL
jgi:hypothetical protein